MLRGFRLPIASIRSPRTNASTCDSLWCAASPFRAYTAITPTSKIQRMSSFLFHSKPAWEALNFIWGEDG